MFWSKRETKKDAKPEKPEWLEWNVPQWVEHLSEPERTRVMTLPQEERTREFLDWYMRKSQEYDSGDSPIGPLNPTGSNTDVGIPWAVRMIEYDWLTR